MVLFQYCFAEKIVLEQRDNEMDYLLFNTVRLLERSSYSPRPGGLQYLSKKVTRLSVFLSSGNRSPACYSVAPKNRMFVADSIVWLDAAQRRLSVS
jgi:hypothetical protein